MSQINFVGEFNAIMDRSRKECLGANGRLLWLALFYLANDRAKMSAANVWDWPDDFFTVDNNELSLHCPLEKRKILDARNRLKQLGVIDFKPGRNNAEAPKYRIVYQSAVQRCKIAPVNSTVNAPVNSTVNAPVNVPAFVPFSINRDININNKQNNITDNIRPLLPDDDLREHQDDHDRIFEAWRKCGFPLTERVMDQLVDLYSVHGVEKLIAAIGVTGDASPKAPMQYLTAVIAGTRKKEPVQGYGGKTVFAQQYTQREYTDEAPDYLDQILSRETEG